MRKIYYLFLTMLLGMVGMTANAEAPVTINLKFNVDEASRVDILINGISQDVVTGKNTFQITTNEYGYFPTVQVKSKADAFLTSVTKADGTSENIYTKNQCHLTIPYGKTEDMEWTIVSVDASTLRTASCTINVDDPSKVKVSRSKTGEVLTLKTGSNTVSYIPTEENAINVQAANYGDVLYSVKFNGNDVNQGYNGYDITLGDNKTDVIDIKAKFPDEDYTVKFEFDNAEDADGFITGVTVDGVAIDNYLSGFTVHAGKKVVISGNPQENYQSIFNVEKCQINGEDFDISYYSGYTFIATKNTVISIAAHKWGEIHPILNVKDASTIVVYKDNINNESNKLELVNGENTLTLDEKNATIFIAPIDGFNIVSVSDGTNEYPANTYTGFHPVSMTKDMVLTVEVEPIVRDKKAAVYVSGKSVASYEFSFTRNTNKKAELVDGYNDLMFNDEETPFDFVWYSPNEIKSFVYLNGTLVNAKNTQNNGATYENIAIADGDVLKIFIAATAPTINNVTFTLSGDEFTASDVTVTYDSVKTLSDLSAGLSAFAGTEVSIAAKNGKVIEVKVDDKAVTADTNGVFTFSVTSNNKVEIKDVTPTGINTINAVSADNSFYTLQGVKVNGKAAKGLYIKNGKKVVVK